MGYYRFRSGLLLLVLSIALLCHSCNKSSKYDAVIQQAEMLMNERPDSSLILLESVAGTGRLSRKQYADWCLLITQARDKNYVQHTSDSLISISAEYYSKKNNHERLVLVYYYMGRVNHDLNNVPKAQEYYLKALEAGQSLNDRALEGRIQNNLGVLYTYQDLPEMALPHLQAAADCFLKTNETRNSCFALRDIGRLFSLLHKPDSAVKYYRQALLYSDSRSRFSVLNNLGDILAEEKDYPSAFYYIRQSLKEIYDPADYYPVYLALGRLFYSTGNADSARYYLNISKKSSRPETRAGSYFYLYHLAKANHLWEEYAVMQERYELLRDSILSRTTTSQMLKMQHLYDYQQAERKASGAELARTRAAINNLILLALFLLMTGSMAAYTLYSRAVKRREQQLQDEVFSQFANKHNADDHDQIRKNIDRIMQLGNLLNIKSIKNKAALRLEKKLLELENTRLSGQNIGKEKGEKQIYSSDIYNKIISGPVQMVSEMEKEAFMAFTDEIYPGLRSGIIRLYPSISADDLFVCYLTRAGIRGKRIAELFFISKQAVSSRRKRLAEILKGDDKVTRSLDDILALL